MATKLGYSPVSIIAASCGTIATAAAASNPVTAPFAVGIGTAASAIVGGTELNEKEQSIKEQLDNALDEAWTTIDNKPSKDQVPEEMYGAFSSIGMPSTADPVSCVAQRTALIPSYVPMTVPGLWSL